MLSGGYNLYEGRLKSSNPVFYLNSKDKPNLMRINPFAVETQLKVYFGDCADKITVKPFYEKERLTRYVKAMNACAYPETVVARNKTKIKPTLSWSINAGVNQQLDIEAGSISGELLRNEAGTFSAQPKFTSGLNLYFNITPAISIFTGAHYIQKAAVADSSSRFSDRAYSIINPNTGEPFTLYARYFYKFQNQFQVHYLECPIAFRFRSSPLSSNGFQALGGITLSFPISKFKANGWGLPYKVEAPVGINPTPTLEDGRSNDRLLTAEQPQIGFFLGTGWHWKLDKRNQVSALLQFHWGKETISTGVSGGVEGQIDFETKRFQLGLAWEFSGKPQ